MDFQYISTKINGFPGFCVGAPGALEISRRREIALWSKLHGSDGIPDGSFRSVELLLIEKSPNNAYFTTVLRGWFQHHDHGVTW